MSRTAVPFAVVVVAALLANGEPASGRRMSPRLTVTNVSPFVVEGTGFRTGEAVRVAVRAEDGRAMKTARASAAGAIVVRFATLKLSDCSAYLVTATGNEGSSARARALPRACGIDPRGAP